MAASARMSLRPVVCRTSDPRLMAFPTLSGSERPSAGALCRLKIVGVPAQAKCFGGIATLLHDIFNERDRPFNRCADCCDKSDDEFRAHRRPTACGCRHKVFCFLVWHSRVCGSLAHVKTRYPYSSPSALSMSRERAKASTVASISASPWVAEIVPPGQPVRSTPFTFIARRSLCAAPGALPRSSS